MIQEEAYSVALDEIERLKAEYGKLAERFDRLQGLLEKVDVSVEKLRYCKVLCARAADALEIWIGDLPASDKHLVQELRKAAQ